MGPDCEDGYTRIANELLEALCRIRIPGESMQIFLVILRKTYGFGKKEDRISLSQFAVTGIVKTHIPRAIEKLESMNIITQKGNIYGITYGINKHYTSWKALPKKVTITQKGNDDTQKGNKSLPKKVTTKERFTKETKTKEMYEICRAWKAYIEMRIKIKKPMTPYAMELRINELWKLKVRGNDPVKVLEQSIASSWQGLFDLKEDKSQPLENPFDALRRQRNESAVT